MEQRKFKLQSAGAAYNLDVGFECTEMTVWNASKWATGGTKVLFSWHKGMAAGTALSTNSTGTNAIEAANGFTLYDTSAVTANYMTPARVTKANPGVVTVTSTAGWVAGNALRFQDCVEMTELNNTTRPIYIKAIINGTTFSIDLDTSGYGAAETTGGYCYNLSKAVDASGFKGMTLGTTVIGADDDILYVTATLADTYNDLGDIA
jgi:hypothetical protein